MFGLLNKNRLLNLEIENEKLHLENESLSKKIKDLEEAIQILATNQAYLASEIASLSTDKIQPDNDPMDEYLKKYDDDGSSGGYLN